MVAVSINPLVASHNLGIAAYPPGDKQVRHYFVNVAARGQELERRDVAGHYLIFFTCLFDVVAEKVQNLSGTALLAPAWRQYLEESESRQLLYEDVVKRVSTGWIIYAVYANMSRSQASAETLNLGSEV